MSSSEAGYRAEEGVKRAGERLDTVDSVEESRDTVQVRQDSEQLRGWISSRRKCKKSRGEAGQCKGGWILKNCTESSSEPGHSGQAREAL